MTCLPRGGSLSGSPLGDSRPFANKPSPPPSFVRVVGTITQLLISSGRAILPPIAGAVGALVAFYRALPMDAIVAQIGLVYCFLGGYYPTLFSSLQAAKHCGWQIAVRAISDLTDEAIKVIDEVEEASADWGSNTDTRKTRRDLFLRQTHIVLKTVDPVKINVAAGALYTTWLGISTILQREYARVINLSLTLAEGMETVLRILLVPALHLVTPKDYHRWVPVLMGWASKALAMRVAWRIERVLTAATSAIAGGAMVARSLVKMLTRYRRRKQKRKLVSSVVAKSSRGSRKRVHDGVDVDVDVDVDVEYRDGVEDDDDDDDYYYDDDEAVVSVGEQAVGFAIGGLGFYTQIESQYKHNFSFVVPFPMSLITFPFDLAERWIQWYITEHPF